MRKAFYTPKRKARATLAWMLFYFAAAQLALGVFLYHRHRDVCDPVYLHRRDTLRSRLSGAPGRPLVLVLGSSRPANGLRPASLETEQSQSDSHPLVFNFSLPGAGPVRELMVLRRLLADGVRPDWVLLEVWAPFMAQVGYVAEEKPLRETDLYWPDLPVIARLYHRRWSPFTEVIERAIFPSVHYRSHLLHRYVPCLLPKANQWLYEDKGDTWVQLDERGWLPHPNARPAPEDWRRLRQQGEYVWQSSTKDFHVSPITDGAIRGILDLCRQQNVKTALFMMPEPSFVRAWYVAPLRAKFNEYLTRLRDRYGVPVVDARDWNPDADFVDAFHLHPDGARTFSERFGREVFQPLLRGQPLPKEALLHESER
jgi:hypothetical protein